MGYADEVFDLTGKVVVVTGGSRGLGEQMVLSRRPAGAYVVIASRKFENWCRSPGEIEAETGRRALPYAVHVGRWDEAEPFVDAVYNGFGRVTSYSTTPGMSPLYDKLTDVSEKLFDSVIGLNFKGPFRLAAVFGERMTRPGAVAIINVSSSADQAERADHPVLRRQGRAQRDKRGLAQGLGPQVRVNTLMPGAMRTDVARPGI